MKTFLTESIMDKKEINSTLFSLFPFTNCSGLSPRLLSLDAEWDHLSPALHSLDKNVQFSISRLPVTGAASASQTQSITISILCFKKKEWLQKRVAAIFVSHAKV